MVGFIQRLVIKIKLNLLFVKTFYVFTLKLESRKHVEEESKK